MLVRRSLRCQARETLNHRVPCSAGPLSKPSLPTIARRISLACRVPYFQTRGSPVDHCSVACQTPPLTQEYPSSHRMCTVSSSKVIHNNRLVFFSIMCCHTVSKSGICVLTCFKHYCITCANLAAIFAMTFLRRSSMYLFRPFVFRLAVHCCLPCSVF